MRKRPGSSAQKPNPFLDKSVGEGEEPEVEDDLEYAALIIEADSMTKSEMLYVPERPGFEPPEVPDDWTTLGGAKLRKLYGAFATYADRAAYLQKIEDGRAKLCKAAADEMATAALAAAEVNKDHVVTHVKAQIEALPEIAVWRKRSVKHETFALSHKMDYERYRNLVEALSRIHTMVKDEWEMSGGKS